MCSVGTTELMEEGGGMWSELGKTHYEASDKIDGTASSLRVTTVMGRVAHLLSHPLPKPSFG